MENPQSNRLFKWAARTVGTLFGVAHIGVLGHLLNKPDYPVLNFPDGDYSSYKVESGKNGYTIEYKANDPTVLESHRSLNSDEHKRGLFGPTTSMRREPVSYTHLRAHET